MRLLEHYLEVRSALGGQPFDFDEAWKSHRLQASYLAPACCQIVTFPDHHIVPDFMPGITHLFYMLHNAFAGKGEFSFRP